MGKRSRNRTRRRLSPTGRVTPSGRRVTGSDGWKREPADPFQGLLDEFRAGMASGGPLDVEMFASMIASCWRRGPLDDVDPSEMAAALIEAVASTARPEAAALLAGLAAVAGEPAAGWARAAVGRLMRAGSVLPDRLADVGAARVVECWRMRDVLGDGDGYLFGCRYPSGGDHALVVYVDHNLGTLVKDAFTGDTSVAEMLADLRDLAGDDPDTVIEPVDPAEAAGRVREALELTDITVPPIETDTYPALRPLLDARLATLPEGFTVPDEPEWSKDERDGLVGEFLASEEGAAWAGREEVEEIAHHLVWFGADYNVGGPLRWSPTVAEVFLVDWFPRKVVAEPEVAVLVPEVTAAWVRFAGRDRGLRPGLVAETVTAISEFAPGFSERFDDPRVWGPAKSFVATMVATGVDLADSDAVAAYVKRANAAARGGTEVGLGRRPEFASAPPSGPPAGQATEPTPFSWIGIPDDLRPRVAEIIAVCDRVCADVLDAEYADLARRLAAKLARKRPSPLARGKTTIWAGGILYFLGQHNWLFYPSAPTHLSGKDLARAVGLTQASIAQKANLVKRSAGLSPNDTEFRRAEINAKGTFASLYRYGL